MGTEVLVGLALAAAGAGAQYVNTTRTEERQDRQLAESIRGQARRQEEADAKVNEEVRKLEQSNAADERAGRLQQYFQTIGRNRRDVQGGITPGIGGAEFQGDAAKAAAALDAYGGGQAALASRIDAPLVQRQGEGFSYGNLATDLSRIGREVAGQAFVDQVKLNRIRRDPWLDAAGSTLQGAGQGMASGAFTNSTIGPVTRQPIAIPVN
jgi:hypothetical protein